MTNPITRAHRLAVARAWEGASEDAFPALVRDWAEFGPTAGTCSQQTRLKLGALERVARMVADAEGAWIPVTERLPDDGAKVLVIGLSGPDQGVYRLDAARNAWYPGGWPVRSTRAWRPLPKPPEPT